MSRQNRWIDYRPITIYFRDATEFGGKATFMPKWRVSDCCFGARIPSSAS